MVNCSVIVRPAGPNDLVIVRVTEYELKCFLRNAHELTKLSIHHSHSSSHFFYVDSVLTGICIASFYLEDGEDIPEDIKVLLD